MTNVEELQMIDSMLRQASVYGLQAEVVWSFGNEMHRQGNEPQDGGVERAVMNALDEWDL